MGLKPHLFHNIEIEGVDFAFPCRKLLCFDRGLGVAVVAFQVRQTKLDTAGQFDDAFTLLAIRHVQDGMPLERALGLLRGQVDGQRNKQGNKQGEPTPRARRGGIQS